MSFSWGAFVVYVAGLSVMVGGGIYGLITYEHRAFLAPILMGLFFFYLTWEAVVETGDPPPPRSRKGN